MILAKYFVIIVRSNFACMIFGPFSGPFVDSGNELMN